MNIQSNIKFNTMLGSFQFIQNILDKAILQVSSVHFDNTLAESSYKSIVQLSEESTYTMSRLKDNLELTNEAYIELKNLINYQLIKLEDQYNALLKGKEINEDESSKIITDLVAKFEKNNPEQVINQITSHVTEILDELRTKYSTNKDFPKINAQYELVLANTQYLNKINIILDTTIYTLKEVEKMLNE